MKEKMLQIMPTVLVGMTTIWMIGCMSANELRKYAFDDQTVAVIAAIPPQPVISSIGDGYWASRYYHPVYMTSRTFGRRVRRSELMRAQAKLDSALHYVDVAELVARKVLLSNAESMGYQTSNDPKTADFILDIRIHDYGILADSWEASTFFTLEGAVLLVDGKSMRPIWEKKFRARERITDTLFGLDEAQGDILTARALALLQVEEMATGLVHLANFTAAGVTNALQIDYDESREK